MLIVQKYGGTSVGTIDRMREVARLCLATQRAGHYVFVIVSAMAGETRIVKNPIAAKAEWRRRNGASCSFSHSRY